METEKASRCMNDRGRTEEVPVYAPHAGTIMVSGHSHVNKTGQSAALEYIKQGANCVELVFLGSNAGHQAYKACTAAKREIEASIKDVDVSFIPLWVKLNTPADGNKGYIAGLKDGSVWRIVLHKKGTGTLKGVPK